MKIKKPDYFIIISSLIAIGFVTLSFTKSNWLYIIPAVIIMIINQKKLIG